MNIGPAYADWDFAALKNFKVTESKQFQFRAELFNILNRTNFHLPDCDISSPTFNHILEADASAPGAVCVEVHVLAGVYPAP